MNDEILKEIYDMKQKSDHLTEEAITKYKEEYKYVCEGTEKLYNLIWKQVIEKAIYNSEKPIYNSEDHIYINIGNGGSLKDIYDKLYSAHYYKNYFKLNDYLGNGIYWLSLEEDYQDIIFFGGSTIWFIKEDLEKKLKQDGFTQIDFSGPLYSVKCVISREKLNEFIALAEEKYKTIEGKDSTLNLNRGEEEQNLDKENLLHINSLCALFKDKYNKDISISEMIDYLKDVMNFDDVQIYLYKYELVGLKLNLNDKLKKLFGLKSNEEILKIYDTLQNFDEDNISVLKRELSTEED